MKTKLSILLLISFFLTGCYTTGFISVEPTPTHTVSIYSERSVPLIYYSDNHWMRYHYYYVQHECLYPLRYTREYKYVTNTERREYKKRKTSTHYRNYSNRRTSSNKSSVLRTIKRISRDSGTQTVRRTPRVNQRSSTVKRQNRVIRTTNTTKTIRRSATIKNERTTRGNRSSNRTTRKGSRSN